MKYIYISYILLFSLCKFASANCDITPYAVQSWTNQGSLQWSSTDASAIIGTYEKSGYVGIPVNVNNPIKRICDSLSCKEFSGLYIQEPKEVLLNLPNSNDFTPGWGISYLNTGHYNTVGSTSGTIILTGATYYIENVHFTGSSTLSLTQDTYLFVNRFELSGSTTLKTNGHKLFIWAENHNGNNAYVEVTRTMVGDVFSRDTIKLSGVARIEGRVTAKHIILEPDSKIINNDLSCSLPTQEPQPAKIIINPNNSHLTCESTPDNQITISVYDENNALISGYIPELKGKNGTKLNIKFISEENGIVTYQIIKKDPTTLENLDIVATLDVKNYVLIDTSTIKYVPFKFNVEDISVYAGEDIIAPLEVLACDDNNKIISMGYQGTPTSNFNYISPSIPENQNDLYLSADISKNSDSLSINFIESGHIRVNLIDNNYLCSDSRCPIEKGVLTGSFEIKSRPWKIAMCNITDTYNTVVNPGTTITSPGFLASGQEFNVTYRPIVHPDSTDVLNNFCNYPITYNYSQDKGEIKLDYELEYPKNELGKLGDLSSININHFSPTSTGVLDVSHSWTEVGTLTLKTSATYLEKEITSNQIDIGRFYPAYFKVDSNYWLNPNNQSFTYMNQPFGLVNVEISSFNEFGSKVTNYGLFDSHLKALFEFSHQDRLANSDVFSIDQNSVYNGSTWKLNSYDIYWKKLSDFTPDGPYNSISGIPLEISMKILSSLVFDPVYFKQSPSSTATNSQVLPNEQPKLYYGRMKFSDVTGQPGQDLIIPLSIEYWNDERFMTNSEDNFSQFNGSFNCLENIWPINNNSTDNVIISGIGQASEGLSYELKAAQNLPIREIVRAKINLDNSTNCNTPTSHWLYYDWSRNGLFEEPPSTTITFENSYRGNDRIIYRGEPGMIGL